MGGKWIIVLRMQCNAVFLYSCFVLGFPSKLFHPGPRPKYSQLYEPGLHTSLHKQLSPSYILPPVWEPTRRLTKRSTRRKGRGGGWTRSTVYTAVQLTRTVSSANTRCQVSRGFFSFFWKLSIHSFLTLMSLFSNHLFFLWKMLLLLSIFNNFLF